MRVVDGDRYVAVASAGGSPKHPGWYANMTAHPLVRLQDGATVGEYLAREVTGEEKTYYWGVAEQFWPHFPEYRRRAAGRDRRAGRGGSWSAASATTAPGPRR